MPTKLRLGLSLSSIKRIFADSTFIESEDALLTQDGNFIALNQNPLQILILDHDFDTTGNHLETQDARALVTQDGRGILTERQR